MQGSYLMAQWWLVGLFYPAKNIYHLTVGLYLFSICVKLINHGSGVVRGGTNITKLINGLIESATEEELQMTIPRWRSKKIKNK